MKKKLLYTLLALLLIANTTLLVLISKDAGNGESKRSHKPIFLVQELNFSEEQKEKFYLLDREHRGHMIQIDSEMKVLKDKLFNSFSNENSYQDSLTNKIGDLTSKRELEIFAFFKQVKNICNPEQEKKLDKIIKKAIKGKRPIPPKGHGKRLPPP